MMTCVDCGAECERKSPSQVRCPACSLAKRRERSRASNEPDYRGMRDIPQEWHPTTRHLDEQALCRRALELERMTATPDRMAEYEEICKQLNVKEAAV